jgi:hypothetical protein
MVAQAHRRVDLLRTAPFRGEMELARVKSSDVRYVTAFAVRERPHYLELAAAGRSATWPECPEGWAG